MWYGYKKQIYIFMTLARPITDYLRTLKSHPFYTLYTFHLILPTHYMDSTSFRFI